MIGYADCTVDLGVVDDYYPSILAMSYNFASAASHPSETHRCERLYR